MKIATTTGDFLGYVTPGDVGGTLALLAESGAKHIDLNFDYAVVPGAPLYEDGWEQYAYDIGNTAARLGLDFVQAHCTDSAYEPGEERERRMAMLRRQLMICKMLGIPGTVIHGIYKWEGAREDFMVKNTAMYKELLTTAEQTDVMIYSENTCSANNPYYYIFEGADCNELCERVDHPLFGFCWDVGHANIQKVDMYKELQVLGKNLKAVHIHDNYASYDRHLQPYVGELCWDAVLKGLVDNGFAGPFTLEAFSAPITNKFCNCAARKPFELDGVVYDKLLMPPVSIKIRSERLMLETARFMLEAYGCYED